MPGREMKRRAFAEEKLENEERLIIRSPNDHPMQNPWLPIANRTMRQMQCFWQNLG